MFIVHVQVHVKPEYIDKFIEASQDNAQNSIKEAGVARYDVIQSLDDPSKFVLVEVYMTPDDAALHKQTGHYARWRDTVAEMMAEPRTGIKYANRFPGEDGW